MSLKHGANRRGKRTREYQAWAHMLNRCRDKNDPHYGGRGITVCSRWLSFAAFLEDMGPRPAGHCLERKDNDKGYSPGNCKWATQSEQQNNKRSNKRITVDGFTKTLSEWCQQTGFSHKLIGRRIDRGWIPKETVFVPPQPPHRPFKALDRSHSI